MTSPATGARLEATVRGRVQGVGYRYFVVRLAVRLGVVGWVANDSDGSVRCVAEGPRPVLEDFLAALKDGPPAGQVDSVVHAWSPSGGTYTEFRVRPRGHTGD